MKSYRKQIGRTVIAAMVSLGICISLSVNAQAQTVQPRSGAAPAKGPAPGNSNSLIVANLLQLMRGTLYPASNVIFAAQDQDPAKIAPAKDPATATDPLASSYGQWQAVENSALAITEVANLLTLPGRKCANGRDVPLRNADWAKLIQGLRDAGQAAYKAAQSKNQDKIVDAAGTLAEACSNCHDKYREKPKMEDRCM